MSEKAYGLMESKPDLIQTGLGVYGFKVRNGSQYRIAVHHVAYDVASVTGSRACC
jgi:hypothetical protein